MQRWLQIVLFSLSYVFMSFYAFCIFYLFVVDKGVSLAPTYSSIVIRISDLRSSLRTKHWLSCFYLFCKIYFDRTKGHLRCWTIKRSFDFERRETLRRWTINDLLVFKSRETLRCWTINDLLGWSTKAGLLLLRILDLWWRTQTYVVLAKAVKLHVDFMLLNGPC